MIKYLNKMNVLIHKITFETSYASNRSEIVYSGKCYQEEVV
jgi:hypothetical protein